MQRGRYASSATKHRTYGIRKALMNRKAHDRAEQLMAEQGLNKIQADEQATREVIEPLKAARAAMTRWSDEVMTLTGAVLLELVMFTQGWGELVTPQRGPTVVEVTQKFFDDYKQVHDLRHSGKIAHWPMLVPPQSWSINDEGLIEGGYLANAGQDSLVRWRRDHRSKSCATKTRPSSTSFVVRRTSPRPVMS